MRHEPPRARDAFGVGPAVARVGIQLRRRYWRLIGRSSPPAAATGAPSSATRRVRSGRVCQVGADVAPSHTRVGGVARQTLRTAHAEPAIVHRQRRPARDAGKVVARQVREREPVIVDRRREVAHVADRHTRLLRQDIGKGFPEPRSHGEHERVGAQLLTGVEGDLVEFAIGDFRRRRATNDDLSAECFEHGGGGLRGAPRANHACIRLVENRGDVVHRDHRKRLAHVVRAEHLERDLVLLPPDLRTQLKIVPLRPEDEIASRVEQVEPELLSPFVIERDPPLDRLARPQHPQFAELAGLVAIGRTDSSCFVARGGPRVARSVRVHHGHLRAHLAQVHRGEASPRARANDDDVG